MSRRRPSPVAHPIADPAAETRTGETTAVLILVAVAAVLAISLMTGAWDERQAPFPFVWRDVAIVSIASGVPLALAMARVLATRLPPAKALGMAVAMFAVSVLASAEPALFDLEELVCSRPLFGDLLRLAVGIGYVLAVAVAAGQLRHSRDEPGGAPVGRFPANLAVLGLVVVAIVPATYTTARCRHDARQLGGYLDQSRFGEAQTLAHRLVRLGCQREVVGRPLPEVAAEVDRIVGELESHLGRFRSPPADAADRLSFAQTLAMLGRTDEAIDVLGTIADPRFMPEAADLRGTLHQNRGEWRDGLDAFRAAKAGWEGRPVSPTRDQAISGTILGIAYCQRKLGRYPEAETNYQELLHRSPTAETEYLLAQFYEDVQRTESARVHTRRAMAMDPDRYGESGEKLLRKMSLSHFGCLTGTTRDLQDGERYRN